MIRKEKAVRLILPLIIFSLVQVYVPASSNTQDTQSPTSTQDARITAVPLVGRLEVHRGKHIRVDNNDVESGATILDGQVLETSDCVSATVHLLPVGMIGPTIVELGQVDIATNSKVLLNYSAGKVKVSIERGCARLRTVPVFEATITTPDGRIVQASGRDSLNRKAAEACHPSNENETYDPTCIPPIVWVVGGVGAAAGIIAVGVSPRGDNPSDTLPSSP